jgi:hypothetical protein
MNHPTRAATLALKLAAVAAVLVAAGVGIAYLAQPSTADPAPKVVEAAGEPTSPDSTFLLTCAHDAVARPVTFDILCGNGTYTLVELDWSHWGRPTATAVGRYVTQDCTPDCADGVDMSYPVSVKVTRRLTRNGVSSYEEVTLTYTGGPPSVLGHSESFDMIDNGHTPTASGN